MEEVFKPLPNEVFIKLSRAEAVSLLKVLFDSDIKSFMYDDFFVTKERLYNKIFYQINN